MIKLKLRKQMLSSHLTRCKYRRVISGILSVLLLSPALTASPLSEDYIPVILGTSLEFRLKEGGSKQYNDLFKNLQKEGLEFDLKILPLKRIMRNFEIGTTPICVFPTSKNAIEKSVPQAADIPMVISDPVDQISLRIFTRPDSPKISHTSELTGKKIALWNGLDAQLLLKDIDVNLETTPNELVRVKMLNAGRIDVILGFTPDVILAAQQLGLPVPHFDEELALFRDEGASLICKDSPENRLFVQNFNAALDTLRQSGKLREILGPYVDLVE